VHERAQSRPVRLQPLFRGKHRRAFVILLILYVIIYYVVSLLWFWSLLTTYRVMSPTDEILRRPRCGVFHMFNRRVFVDGRTKHLLIMPNRIDFFRS